MRRLMRLTFVFMLAVICSLAHAGETRQRELRLPNPAARYIDEPLPKHFRTANAATFDNTPTDNPLTDAGVQLGRVLFYDTRVSASGQISCASCHLQKHAFADPRRFSAGHSGQQVDRNSMSLVNLRYSKAGKFWDERVATLEEQVLIPIQSRVEMGQSLDALTEMLQNDSRYPVMFEQSFGDATINADRVAKALSQFLRALVSYRSKYDQGLAQVKTETDDFPNFTAAENLGKGLFLEKCAICHRDGRGRQSAFFTSFRSLNNGIDESAETLDAGNGDITLVPSDIGLFRPSDLRNVEFTAPYMHDGRFATLEEVINHYSDEIKRHPNVSGFAFRMHFTDEQKAAIVAFLKTLTDHAFLNDVRFSDPWHDSSENSTVNDADTLHDAVAATPQKTSPPSELTSQERAKRLDNHIGLPCGESLLYLQDLDQNADQSLSREETIALAERLLHNGPPARFDRRRFTARDLRIARASESAPALMAFDRDGNGHLTANEFPESRRYVIEVADLDGDNEITTDEARRFETVERFIAAQAGDRDRTRIVRLIESLRLSTDQAERVQQSLQTAQEELRTQKESLDTALTRQLADSLGANNFAQFQELLLVNQDSLELSRRAGDISVNSIQDQIFEFDDNHNSQLEGSELMLLASVLDETPGGFGTARSSLPSIGQYSRRIMSRDTDHDGAVTLLEIPERYAFLVHRGDANQDGKLSQTELDNYLRNTSYERFLVEGIYQSGGFLNAFKNAARFLDQIDLADADKQAIGSLLESHEKQIQNTINQAVASAYGHLKQATGWIAPKARPAP